jgi:rare lipoprotein A
MSIMKLFKTRYLFVIMSLYMLLGGCASRSYIAQSNVAKSYQINGKTYHTMKTVNVGHEQKGVASWYGPGFHGKKTASGEKYDMFDYTAAHSSLPLDTVVRVKNLKTDKEVVLRINDRGPFVGDRVLDVSLTAARELGMIGPGTAPINLKVIKPGETRLASKSSGNRLAKAEDKTPNPFFSTKRLWLLAWGKD